MLPLSEVAFSEFMYYVFSKIEIKKVPSDAARGHLTPKPPKNTYKLCSIFKKTERYCTTLPEACQEKNEIFFNKIQAAAEPTVCRKHFSPDGKRNPPSPRGRLCSAVARRHRISFRTQGSRGLSASRRLGDTNNYEFPIPHCELLISYFRLLVSRWGCLGLLNLNKFSAESKFFAPHCKKLLQKGLKYFII